MPIILRELLTTNNIHPLLVLTIMVYLHCPNVFHSLMVLSRDADTICLLSAEKATLSTSFVCPTNRLVVLPLENLEYEVTET